MKNNIIRALLLWIRRKIEQTFHCGETCQVKHPKRKRSSSKSQLINQDRFRQAAAHAKVQMRDPEMKAAYETGINKKKQSAYAVAFIDALKALNSNSVPVYPCPPEYIYHQNIH